MERLNETDKLVKSLGEQVKQSTQEIEDLATKRDTDALKQRLTSIAARMDEFENLKQLDDSRFEEIRVLAKTLPSQIKQI